MTTFNERLKALREAAGLTQEGLARAADVSVSTVSKLEQLGQDPAWSTVEKLAAGLGVSVAAFATSESGSEAESEKVKGKKQGRKRNSK